MQKLLGFSLIELMVVIAIVAVLSAVAVPSYKSYVTKTKIASGFNILEKMKTLALEYYNKNGAWPPNLTALGLPSYSSSLITSLGDCTGATGCAGAYNASGNDYRGDYGFYVRMNPAELGALPSGVVGPALILNVDSVGDTMVWYCTTDSSVGWASSSIPKSLLPGGCVHPDP